MPVTIRPLALPIAMFGLSASHRADYAEVILKMVNQSIEDNEGDAKEMEAVWLSELIGMKTTDKDEKKDFTITYAELKVKLAKAEKNVWVAIKNFNWVLTEPFRQKMRQISDDLMEHLELGIQKGWVSEKDYINRCDEFAHGLNQTEKVTETLKMWFAVKPTDRNKLNQWWR